MNATLIFIHLCIYSLIFKETVTKLEFIYLHLQYNGKQPRLTLKTSYIFNRF